MIGRIMNCRAHHSIAEPVNSESARKKLSEMERERSIQGLLQLIRHYLPSMALDLQPASDKELTATEASHKLIGQLYQAIQQSEPNAGRFYWSAQCWNMLCWQPVILSMVSASQFRLITDVNQMGQRVQGARIAGLSIPHSAFVIAPGSGTKHSDTENSATESSDTKNKDLSLIRASGLKLKELLESLLALSTEHFPLNQNLARRLFADRMLSTLLLLQRLNNQGVFNEASNRHTEALAQQWLEATELQGASGLMRIEFTFNTASNTANDTDRDTHNQANERLALNRKGCCQHFRKSDGKVCASCPKNKMPERIQLIQQSWREAG